MHFDSRHNRPLILTPSESGAFLGGGSLATPANSLYQPSIDSPLTLPGSKYLHRLKGQVLFDLCAGTTSFGALLAQAFNAKSYVGVEMFFPDDLRNALEAERVTGRLTIPTTVLHCDTLFAVKDFIADRSASFFIAGLDRCMFPKDEHWQTLREEIGRTLSNTGLLVILEFLGESLAVPLNEVRELEYGSAENRFWHYYARDNTP